MQNARAKIPATIIPHRYHYKTILDDCDEVTYVCPGSIKVSCSHWIVPGTFAERSRQ